LYFDEDHVEERHRHRFEVNQEYIAQIEEKGMKFVGRDVDGERMEILELKDHPYYVATQFHPEFLSRPMSPSPVFNGFILAAAGKLDRWLEKRPTKLEVFSPAGRTESQEESMKHVGFRPSRPSWMIPDSPPPSPSKSAPSSPAKMGQGGSPTLAGSMGGASTMAL
jgi:hypothetical protein